MQNEGGTALLFASATPDGAALSCCNGCRDRRGWLLKDCHRFCSAE